MKQANIELHIDRLILEGLPDVNRDQLGEVFRQELERLFLEKGIPQGLRHGGSLAQLNGKALKVGHEAKGDSVGIQLAQSVYGGFRR